MCFGNKSPAAPVTPKVTASPAAGPKNNNPELELAAVDTDSSEKNKQRKGKRGLRVSQKNNAIGTPTNGAVSLNIPVK